MNQAYSRLSTTHGRITDCRLLVGMYWTRLVLVRPAASLYSASPLKHHPTGLFWLADSKVVWFVSANHRTSQYTYIMIMNTGSVLSPVLSKMAAKRKKKQTDKEKREKKRQKMQRYRNNIRNGPLRKERMKKRDIQRKRKAYVHLRVTAENPQEVTKIHRETTAVQSKKWRKVSMDIFASPARPKAGRNNRGKHFEDQVNKLKKREAVYRTQQWRLRVAIKTKTAKQKQTPMMAAPVRKSRSTKYCAIKRVKKQPSPYTSEAYTSASEGYEFPELPETSSKQRVP